MDFLFVQFLNGLASASSLFLVASGLTIIFGVTRIVNFAHGSLYMLGAYLAYTLAETLGRGPLGFWSAVVIAALAVASYELWRRRAPASEARPGTGDPPPPIYGKDSNDDDADGGDADGGDGGD